MVTDQVVLRQKEDGLTPAVFLDRDGVINRKAAEGDYIKHIGEVEMLPGVGPAIRRLNEEGWRVVVVTNQRGVARGLMSLDALESVNRLITDELSSEGATLDGIFYCTHEKTDGCSCRKPRPGLLLKGATELGLDLEASWLVGDSESDIEAGLAAGCRTIRLCHATSSFSSSRADVVLSSLVEAVEYICSAPARGNR